MTANRNAGKNQFKLKLKQVIFWKTFGNSMERHENLKFVSRCTVLIFYSVFIVFTVKRYYCRFAEAADKLIYIILFQLILVNFN